jgi:hypothetical protein
MSEKWTKGPWHKYVDEDDNIIAISYQYKGPNGGACRSSIAQMPVPGAYNNLTRNEINANGCLIQAAPALYEALKRLTAPECTDKTASGVPFMRDNEFSRVALIEARAALRQARGEGEG